MPSLTIEPEDSGFSCRYFGPWSWAPRKGNPAQAHGEPFPSNEWVLMRTIELYEYRRSGLYKQSDAIRQWLIDYGMIVQMKAGSGVVVKW